MRRVPACAYITPPTTSGTDCMLKSGRGPRLSVLKRQAMRRFLALSLLI